MKKEFTYKIEKECGVVSTAGSLPLEMNLISFNGAPAKYDLHAARPEPSQLVRADGANDAGADAGGRRGVCARDDVHALPRAAADAERLETVRGQGRREWPPRSARRPRRRR